MSDDHEEMTDPRVDAPCTACEQTFAWEGFDGLCGWCYEERLLSGGRAT